jgi:hypothetical protein
MTKREWSRCSDPLAMLRDVRGQASARKLRLFAVACCRRVWGLLPSDNGRFAVLAAERFADGQVDGKTLKAAYETAHREADTEPGYATPEVLATRSAMHAARPTLLWAFPEKPGGALSDARRCAELAVGFRKLREAGPPGTKEERTRWSWWGGDFERPEDYWSLGDEEEKAHQADLLREILGGLDDPVAFDPVWLQHSQVRGLARGIYEGYHFDLMPKLGQALRWAGCKRARLLDHCKQETHPHYRGCWLLDGLLDKR